MSDIFPALIGNGSLNIGLYHKVSAELTLNGLTRWTNANSDAYEGILSKFGVCCIDCWELAIDLYWEEVGTTI